MNAWLHDATVSENPGELCRINDVLSFKRQEISWFGLLKLCQYKGQYVHAHLVSDLQGLSAALRWRPG